MSKNIINTYDKNLKTGWTNANIFEFIELIVNLENKKYGALFNPYRSRITFESVIIYEVDYHNDVITRYHSRKNNLRESFIECFEKLIKDLK